MKKILYITDESDLNRFNDKNRLYRYEAIKKNNNFVCMDISKIDNKSFLKVKQMLMGLVFVAMLYALIVIMFILDGAPFHN